MKKLITNKHSYLIKEVESDQHKDCIFGHNILLSIYVGKNKKNNSLSGQFHYFNEKPHRIARLENIVSVEEPSENELEFAELLREKKYIGYSRKLAAQYGFEDIVYFYDIEEKES